MHLTFGQADVTFLIRKMTLTLFAITCRIHVAGQQVVSDVSVVRSCWSRPICSLCSESDNPDLILRLLIAVLETCILLHTPNMDTEFSDGDVIAPETHKWRYRRSDCCSCSRGIIERYSLFSLLITVLVFEPCAHTTRGRHVLDIQIYLPIRSNVAL